MKCFIECLLCGKTMEAKRGRRLDSQAIENGWSEVSIKNKNFEESFFICNSCLNHFYKKHKD